ncbi:unnamed protein product, partial [Prorocentrum cordatum]
PFLLGLWLEAFGLEYPVAPIFACRRFSTPMLSGCQGRLQLLSSSADVNSKRVTFADTSWGRSYMQLQGWETFGQRGGSSFSDEGESSDGGAVDESRAGGEREPAQCRTEREHERPEWRRATGDEGLEPQGRAARGLWPTPAPARRRGRDPTARQGRAASSARRRAAAAVVAPRRPPGIREAVDAR